MTVRHRGGGRRATAPWRRDETGGIVTGWMFQILVIMAIIGVVGFEVITVAVTSINLDDQAREVAIAARDAYRDHGDVKAAQEAASTTAEAVGTTLVSVETDDQYVYVTVTTTADTLFIDRIGALDSLTHPTTRSRAPWRG